MKSSFLSYGVCCLESGKERCQSRTHRDGCVAGLGLRPILHLAPPERLVNEDAIVRPFHLLPRQAKTFGDADARGNDQKHSNLHRVGSRSSRAMTCSGKSTFTSS